MFFYLVFVLIVVPLLTLRGPRLTALMVVLFAIGAFIMSALASFYIGDVLAHLPRLIAPSDDAKNPANALGHWFYYFSPYMRLPEFLLGCLTAHLYVTIGKADPSRMEQRVATAALVGALCFLAAVAVNANVPLFANAQAVTVVNIMGNNFLLAPALAIVIFCACRYRNTMSEFLSLPILVALGELSYSLYLSHTFTLRLFVHPLVPLTAWSALEVLVRIVVAMLFAVIVSFATYRLIEVPARRWLRSRLGVAAPPMPYGAMSPPELARGVPGG